jgi:hypothetical protein
MWGHVAGYQGFDLLHFCLKFGLRELLDPPTESVSGDLRGRMEV